MKTSSEEAVVLSEARWRRLGMTMLTRAGVSKADAASITDVLVTGGLAGIDSHGVRNLARFAKRSKNEVRVVKESLATALLDPGETPGPVYAKHAMELAISKARRCGIGCCSVRAGDWVTNLFYYLLMAAKSDMIAFAFVRTPPAGAAWGGIKPVFGTNPIGAAFPAEKRYPIVLDFATTIVSQGQTKSMSLKGKPMPDGWFIDREGKPTGEVRVKAEDWREFMNEHALLPFGTYKGYGIAVAVELMGGALNLVGTGTSSMGVNGLTAIAIDVAAFVPVTEFKREVDRYVVEVKSSPVRRGFEEVLLPGEREFRTMEERRKAGIPVDDASWRAIVAKCESLGVGVEAYAT